MGSKVNTISGWETGNRRVNLDDLSRLAVIYEISVADLLRSPEADPMVEKAVQRPEHEATNGAADTEAQKAMGVRLKAARDALGLTQEDMARHMGVVVTTLSAWESGRNQIDIVKLAMSATRWGFTTDWVARGDLSGLRKDLADKVEAMIEKGPSRRRGRAATVARIGVCAQSSDSNSSSVTGHTSGTGNGG